MSALCETQHADSFFRWVSRKTLNPTYVLIARPDSRTQFNGAQNKPRLNALFEVMRDLENHQAEILELVNSGDDWEQVETRLERIFNYSRAANDSFIVEKKAGESKN